MSGLHVRFSNVPIWGRVLQVFRTTGSSERSISVELPWLRIKLRTELNPVEKWVFHWVVPHGGPLLLFSSIENP